MYCSVCSSNLFWTKSNLSLRDNILCTVKELDITAKPDGTPTTTSIIQLDISGRIDGVIVISAINQTNSGVYPTSGVFVSWVQTQNGILINNITGLPSGQKFKVKMVAFGQ